MIRKLEANFENKFHGNEARVKFNALALFD